MHGVVLEREQHAVVAETESERTGHVAVERIDVTRAGAGEAEDPSRRRMAVGWSKARTSAWASSIHSIR